MKLGFIQVYNEMNWIGFTIDQAMKLCDKLLIIEGSQFVDFPDIPERSTDGTLDIISDKIKQYGDRIIRFNTTREHKNYRHNQCDNFNQGLQFCDIDDYFLILDADDFFIDGWIKNANAIMQEGKVDLIYVNSYDFLFGFNWIMDFGKSSLRPIIIKKTEGLKFVPTHTIKEEGNHTHISGGISRYHYKWLKPKERIRIRMKTSRRGSQAVEWFESIWCKMELEADKIYPCYNGKFTLRRYDGVHPSILKNHPWRNVGDIRELRI